MRLGWGPPHCAPGEMTRHTLNNANMPTEQTRAPCPHFPNGLASHAMTVWRALHPSRLLLPMRLGSTT